MKKIVWILVAFILISTIALPFYLGPDDIATCAGPTENGICQKADAIIAVSGGDTEARTAEAIRLYKIGWADMLIFSGAALDKTGPSNAEVMREQALEADVPQEDIWVEEFSNTTAENAENSTKLVEEMGLRRVMLVTSAYHQRRTSVEFSKRLGETVQIVNHPVANDKQWSSWWWLTPYGWWLGLGEVFKIVFSGFSSAL